MCLPQDPQSVMDDIAATYKFKSGKAEEPTAYLGANIGKYEPRGPDTPSKRYMSGDINVKWAVEDVEREMPEHRCLIDKGKHP